MNTLYFVKFWSCKPPYDTIVFCLTAIGPDEAQAKGWTMISKSCVDDYCIDRVESICNTPDEVLCFEPV